MKWETKALVASVEQPSGVSSQDMAYAGGEGWELVSICYGTGVTYRFGAIAVAVFKRPIRDEAASMAHEAVVNRDGASNLLRAPALLDVGDPGGYAKDFPLEKREFMFNYRDGTGALAHSIERGVEAAKVKTRELGLWGGFLPVFDEEIAKLPLEGNLKHGDGGNPDRNGRSFVVTRTK